MQRDDQELGPAGVLEPNVAATLAYLLPTDPLECLDQVARPWPWTPRWTLRGRPHVEFRC